MSTENEIEQPTASAPAVGSRDWLGLWLDGEISAGKACELLGVQRHIGEEILTAIWRKQEALKMAQYAFANCGIFQWKDGMMPAWHFVDISDAVDKAIRGHSPNSELSSERAAEQRQQKESDARRLLK